MLDVKVLTIPVVVSPLSAVVWLRLGSGRQHLLLNYLGLLQHPERPAIEEHVEVFHQRPLTTDL